MRRALLALCLLLCGCGDAFVLVCDALGYQIVETGPAAYPSSSVVVPEPLPPRSTRPAPGARRSR